MKRMIKVVGIVVAVLLIIVIAIPFFLNADQFRPLLQTKLSAALGREVTLGNLKLSLMSGSVTASDLSIADDLAFSKTPFLKASSLDVGVEVMPLILSRRLNVTGITIDQPQIDLVQNSQGMWNFSSIGAKTDAAAPAASTSSSGAAPDLSVKAIKISDGKITLTKTVKPKPLVLDKLNITVNDFAPDSPFTFTLAAVFSGGGDIKLDGKAGPINSGDAIATPVNANLHITHLDLAISGAFDPELGVTGISTVDGNLASSRAVANVTGKLKGEQLRLVKAGKAAKKPLEVDFTVVHDLRRETGKIERGDIHLGKAVASLTGPYNDSGRVPSINIKLTGKQLDVAEIGAFLPAIDVVLPLGAEIDQGTAELNFTAEGPADRLTAAGTVEFNTVRLANFDLASKLSVMEELAGLKAGPHTEIEKFHASMKYAPDGSQVEDIDLVVPSIGEMTGSGTVSPAHELNFKMRAAVRSVAGKLADIGEKGGVPFTITGTSEKPEFKPDVKDIVKEKLKDLTGGLFGGKKKN